MIYEDRANPGRYHWTNITEDQEYLILYIAEGTDGFECYFKRLDDNRASFKPLFTGFRHKSTIVDHNDGKFLVRTDIDAPNYRLVSIYIEGDQSKLMDVIPESTSLLHGVSTAGGFLFANYLENASSKVYQVDYSGNVIRQVDLPEMGSIDGFDTEREDSLIFYTLSSFTQPGSVYRFNPGDGRSSVFFEPQLLFAPSEYIIDQIRYQGADETEVSMFLVYKKGIRMDGNNPCWLYGYGGFNISLTPGFKTSRIPWLENGGIFAMPNLRGGGEYGEEWHKAGMLLKKQNVFDDFIAAAEFLVDKKYTSSEKLVVEGRSNGGLLVGAVMTQRSGLMQVALPGVGVMDMLRYHKFTVRHGWVREYGSSDAKEHFDNLYSYSPLHNIKKGAAYPATLVYTGDHDDRVVPAHSFKFIATLQEAQGGSQPVLIRIETKAGHGSGKPISKQLEEEADKLAFAFYNTNFAPYIPR